MASSGPAFTSPAPSSSPFFHSEAFSRRRNRPKVFSHFLRRANVAPNARLRSNAHQAKQGIRFENLFLDTSAATVLTPESEPVSLIDHVHSRNAAGETVLLGWLRHFGCSLCKKQTSDWMSLQSKFDECGNVCITLVGNGPARHAIDFIEEMNWNGYLFTDPDRRTYKALQFRAGLLATFNRQALGRVITSFREGNKQTWKRMPTDAFQQGGAVLVDTTGTVRMFHADAFAGDHYECDQLVTEVCAIAQ